LKKITKWSQNGNVFDDVAIDVKGFRLMQNYVHNRNKWRRQGQSRNHLILIDLENVVKLMFVAVLCRDSWS